MAEWLMNNLDKVIIPLITSLLTYFAAVYKGRNELKKQVQTNRNILYIKSRLPFKTEVSFNRMDRT